MSYLSLEAIPLPEFYQVCFGKHGKIGDLSKKKAVIYKLQVEVSPIVSRRPTRDFDRAVLTYTR